MVSAVLNEKTIQGMRQRKIFSLSLFPKKINGHPNRECNKAINIVDDSTK
jgi:hypothetical protein